jgi:hypothetical protein
MATEMSLSDYISPKVFISYSWTSDDYADWVKGLAEKLINNGVDVILDRWDLKPGQDKFVFMEQMVTNPEIKKVLLMCDKRYAERADSREGGVGTESTIISQEVYNQVNQEKFIPVVTERGPDGEAYLPAFIKSRIYIDISDPNLFERGYEDLLRTLTGRPASGKPPLGKPPSYLFETSRPTSPTTFALRAFDSALMADKRHSTGLARDYLDRLYDTLKDMQVDVENVKEKAERDGLMLKRLEDWNPLRDEWVSFLRTICRYGTDPRLFEALPSFFESVLTLAGGVREPRWKQHLYFIIHEAFLYAVTVLLQELRFDTVALLLSSHYRDPERRESIQRYGIFYHRDTRYLEELLNRIWSKQDNVRGYAYPHTLWIHRRANQNSVPIELLIEADVILWLRYKLESVPDAGFRMLSWFPVTVGSLGDYDWRVSIFPIFQRAASRRFFEQFKAVLGVDSKDELLHRWDSVVPKDSEFGGDGFWKRAFNIEELATTG